MDILLGVSSLKFSSYSLSIVISSDLQSQMVDWVQISFMRQRKCGVLLQNKQEEVYTPQCASFRENKNGSSYDNKEGKFSSSTKTKAKGLSQKEKELLEYFNDDPNMRQVVLQKILDKQGDSDDETVSSAASSSPPKPEDLQDSQDPYAL